VLNLYTFAGKRLSERIGLLATLSSWLVEKGYSIHSLSSSDSFISLYLEGEVDDGLFNELHGEFIEKRRMFDGLTRVKNVGEIKLSNHIFIESPGMISLISENLLRERINIIEMITAHTDIIIYTSRAVLEKSAGILRKAFGLKR
jgi:aspartokinase